jgi:hypothetical protein
MIVDKMGMTGAAALVVIPPPWKRRFRTIVALGKFGGNSTSGRRTGPRLWRGKTA